MEKLECLEWKRMKSDPRVKYYAGLLNDLVISPEHAKIVELPLNEPGKTTIFSTPRNKL